MKKPNIALIGPDFFSYVQSVRDEFIRRGYRCVFYDERHSNSIFSKIAYRLKLTFIVRSKRDSHINKILEDIIQQKTEHVFLISTEVVDRNFILALQSRNIKVTLYLWDSLENKSPAKFIFDLIPRKGTFDVVDAQELALNYIPLFAEDTFSALAHRRTLQSRLPQLVFCGTLHSHRANLLLSLRQAVKKSPFSILELIFYHSKILYFIKSRFIIRYLIFLPNLKTKGFSKTDIASAFFSSVGVLDIHHPGQTGLTSRTFEALRAGAFLVTLNQHAASLPRELQSRLMVLTNASELQARLNEIPVQLGPLSPEMDHFLSLARFVDDLTTLAGLTAMSAERVT